MRLEITIITRSWAQCSTASQQQQLLTSLQQQLPFANACCESKSAAALHQRPRDRRPFAASSEEARRQGGEAGRSEETRSDEARSKEARSKEARSKETRSKEAKSEESRSAACSRPSFICSSSTAEFTAASNLSDVSPPNQQRRGGECHALGRPSSVCSTGSEVSNLSEVLVVSVGLARSWQKKASYTSSLRPHTLVA